MALPFDFVVPGTPVSAQARRRELRDAWQHVVSGSAHAVWPLDDEPQMGELSATIVYFHVGPPRPDVDNIAKPILDALKGLVYRDDRAIVQLLVRRTKLEPSFAMRNPPPVLATTLAQAREEDFVYAQFSGSPDHRRFPS